MERKIVHFEVDELPVNVEIKKDARLKGWPVAIGGTGDRGIVLSCSPEARRHQVDIAMPIRLAKRYCPQLVVIRGDYDEYQHYSKIVNEIIAEKTPKFEQATLNQFYADLTGMDQFFGCYKYSEELRKYMIAETGLPASFALASNKMISKVATKDAQPCGRMQVIYGREKLFLAPRPIEHLPLISPERGRLLRKMGIETIEQLSEMPIPYLENKFPNEGRQIWKRANGIDETPIIGQVEQKSLSVDHIFDQDTTDMDQINSRLVLMTEDICFRLRMMGYLTGQITVKLRYANSDNAAKQKVIIYNNSDHILIGGIKTLFNQLYERRMLIRRIGIRFTNLVPGTCQINLFEDTEERIRLNKAIDHIKRAFGANMITIGKLYIKYASVFYGMLRNHCRTFQKLNFKTGLLINHRFTFKIND